MYRLRPQRVPCHHVVAADVARRAVLRGDRDRTAGHLLRAERQRQVEHPRRDPPVRLPERRGPAGARVFHVDDRHAGQPQLRQRRLADGHPLVVNVPEVGHRYRRPRHSRIAQCVDHGISRQVRQALLGKPPEGVQTYAHHHHVASRPKLRHHSSIYRAIMPGHALCRRRGELAMPSAAMLAAICTPRAPSLPRLPSPPAAKPA